MANLILPSKDQKDASDRRFKDDIQKFAFGKYKDDPLHPDMKVKYRHALTHWIAAQRQWGVIKEDWCPNCNGQLQHDFDDWMAEQRAAAEQAQRDDVNAKLAPTLDRAKSQGKLLQFPTKVGTEDERPNDD